MNSQEKLNLLTKRFIHDNSLFAEQKYFAEERVMPSGKVMKKGTYFFPVRYGDCKHGSEHKQKDCPDMRDGRFTDKHLLQHLKGEATYAPYQISEDGTVKWVCFDVDAYDAEESEIQKMTVNVVRRIQKYVGPRHALVEKSGSKGYHIWVFFDQPVKVNYAFAFGHMVVNDIGIDQNLTVEVYPKQRSNAVFGNTVKLPLGLHQKTGTRCVFVSSSFEPYEDQWEVLNNVRLISHEWIEQNVDVRFQPKEDNERKEYVSWVPKCLVEILDEGAGEGIRDEAAFRLACYLRDKGLNQNYGTVLLEEWNNKNKPPLDDDELMIKIESAYGRDYPWRPCMIPGFDAHCQSSCAYFERKVKQRWFKKDKNPVGIISRE